MEQLCPIVFYPRKLCQVSPFMVSVPPTMLPGIFSMWSREDFPQWMTKQASTMGSLLPQQLLTITCFLWVPTFFLGCEKHFSVAQIAPYLSRSHHTPSRPQAPLSALLPAHHRVFSSLSEQEKLMQDAVIDTASNLESPEASKDTTPRDTSLGLKPHGTPARRLQEKSERLAILNEGIKSADRYGSGRYKYYPRVVFMAPNSPQPTTSPNSRTDGLSQPPTVAATPVLPQIARILTPSPRLTQPDRAQTPPLLPPEARPLLRVSPKQPPQIGPRTPYHGRIDTRRVHDVLDKIRGVDRMAEARRTLLSPRGLKPPTQAAVPVPTDSTMFAANDKLDPSPVFTEIHTATDTAPQDSVTMPINDSRTIYSSPTDRSGMAKRAASPTASAEVASAPATLRRPRKRIHLMSSPGESPGALFTDEVAATPKAKEVHDYFQDSPSLVYGAPVTPPKWTRLQWQYLSALVCFIPELQNPDLDQVKAFVETGLPDWLIEEFYPFRNELPSRIMALLKWRRAAKPEDAAGQALTAALKTQVLKILMTKVFPHRPPAAPVP